MSEVALALIQYVAAGRLLADVGLQAHRPLDPYRRAPVLRRIGVTGAVGLVGFIVAATLLAGITRHSVLDSRRAGLEVTVLTDAIAGVDMKAGDSDRAIEDMQAAGAHLSGHL